MGSCSRLLGSALQCTSPISRADVDHYPVWGLVMWDMHTYVSRLWLGVLCALSVVVGGLGRMGGRLWAFFGGAHAAADPQTPNFGRTCMSWQWAAAPRPAMCVFSFCTMVQDIITCICICSHPGIVAAHLHVNLKQSTSKHKVLRMRVVEWRKLAVLAACTPGVCQPLLDMEAHAVIYSTLTHGHFYPAISACRQSQTCG